MARAAAESGSSTMDSFSSINAPHVGVLRGLIRLLQEQSIADIAYSFRDQVRLVFCFSL